MPDINICGQVVCVEKQDAEVQEQRQVGREVAEWRRWLVCPDALLKGPADVGVEDDLEDMEPVDE